MLHRFSLTIGWTFSAVVAGWISWGAIVLLLSLLTASGTLANRIAGLYMSMIFAGFVALVVGLPATFFFIVIWQFISKRVPKLDETFRGILIGCCAIAFTVAVLHQLLYIFAYTYDKAPHFFFSAVLFTSIVCGLIIPRRLVNALRPGVFAN